MDKKAIEAEINRMTKAKIGTAIIGIIFIWTFIVPVFCWIYYMMLSSRTRKLKYMLMQA